MIVCLCRDLNSTKIRDAISAGARSPAQVHAFHETTINCGKCCETVCGMIRDTSAQRDQTRACMMVAAE